MSDNPGIQADILLMQEHVVRWTKTKGWWQDGRTFGDDMALLHSEISEALEAFREWGFADMTIQLGKEPPIKPQGVGSEMADILVRLLHFCAEHDIDLIHEFWRKMEYNETRAYRHGGKAL